MTMPSFDHVMRLAVFATGAVSVALACTLSLSGCASNAPAPSVNTEPVGFDQAVSDATDALAAQIQRLPAFAAQLDKRALVIDPMIDGASGQQTVVTKQLEDKVNARLAAQHAALPVLPFKLSSLNRSQYVMTGTMTRLQDGKTGNRAPFQIHLALTELKTGLVVAQASSRALGDGLDTTPTPYYRDSPVLVKDKIVDGYIRTSQTPPGQPAVKDYFDRLATATTLNEGTLAYNSERYQEALDLYKTALAAPYGEQLRTFNGIYLASWKLGRTQEAETAFGKIVALGIASSNLGVKFLFFNPGTTDFWSDPKISGPYAIWVRQIARQTAQAKVCMDIVGHTSRTGGEAFNDKLSAQRAAVIRQRLGSESADLLGKTKTNGVGFRENIIGTGSDDASDALDRRVEFKIGGC
jgi:tetratricopeptide (TPR) repeat protein